MELGMVYDGRAGDPTVLDETARKKIAAFVDERVGDFRCPDHGKAPTITVTGDSVDALSFEVTGCCTKLIVMTHERLEGPVE